MFLKVARSSEALFDDLAPLNSYAKDPYSLPAIRRLAHESYFGNAPIAVHSSLTTEQDWASTVLITLSTGNPTDWPLRAHTLRGLGHEIMRMASAIVGPKATEKVWQAAVEGCDEAGRQFGADVVRLFRQDRLSISPLLTALAKMGKRYEILTDSICHQIVLPDDLQDYWMKKSRKSRYNLRRSFKRLKEELPSARLIRSRGETADSQKFSQCRYDFMNVMRRAWQFQELSNDERSKKFQFIEALIDIWAKAGQLEFVLLKADDLLLAASLNVIIDNVSWVVFQYYDNAYASHSPGRLLFWLHLEKAHELGDRLIELGGANDHWKSFWSNRKVRTVQVSWELNSRKSQLWALGKRIFSVLRRKSKYINNKVEIISLQDEACWNEHQTLLTELSNGAKNARPFNSYSYWFNLWKHRFCDNPFYLYHIENKAALLLREKMSKHHGLSYRKLVSIDTMSMACHSLLGPSNEDKLELLASMAKLTASRGSNLLTLYRQDEASYPILRNYLRLRNLPYRFDLFTQRQRIKLNEGFATYKSKLSKKMVKDVERRMRKVERDKDVSLSFQRYCGSEILDAGFDELWEKVLSVYNNTWQAIQTRKNFDDAAPFYGDLARSWANEEILDLALLYDGDKPIAFFLNVIDKNTLWLVLTGYLPKYKKLGVGAQLFYKLLEDCDRRGFHSIDLGGECNDWKVRWCNDQKPLYNVTMALSGRRAHFWELATDLRKLWQQTSLVY